MSLGTRVSRIPRFELPSKGLGSSPPTKILHALHRHVRATAHPCLVRSVQDTPTIEWRRFLLVARACARDLVGVGVRESRHGGVPWEVTLRAIERAVRHSNTCRQEVLRSMTNGST